MTSLDPVSPRARDTLSTKNIDSGPANDALSRINSPWYLPAPFLFELSFPGSSARPVESGKVEKFRTGNKFRDDLASEADYIICRKTWFIL